METISYDLLLLFLVINNHMFIATCNNNFYLYSVKTMKNKLTSQFFCDIFFN